MKPKIIAITNQKGGVEKTQACTTSMQKYADLVKEVQSIGEKQRGKPFDVG